MFATSGCGRCDVRPGADVSDVPPDGGLPGAEGRRAAHLERPEQRIGMLGQVIRGAGCDCPSTKLRLAMAPALSEEEVVAARRIGCLRRKN